MSLGMRDFTKAERSPGCRIDMSTWYEANSHCTHCFAGAVMIFSLKRGTHGGHLVPDSFDHDTQLKLMALDHARRGQFANAIDTMSGCSVKPPPGAYSKAMQLSRNIPDYHVDKAGFRKGVRKATRDLRAVGL